MSIDTTHEKGGAQKAGGTRRGRVRLLRARQVSGLVVAVFGGSGGDARRCVQEWEARSRTAAWRRRRISAAAADAGKGVSRARVSFVFARRAAGNLSVASFSCTVDARFTHVALVSLMLCWH